MFSVWFFVVPVRVRRSVAILAAYFMCKRGTEMASVSDVLGYIKLKYPWAEPNPGFVEQVCVVMAWLFFLACVC